MEAEQKKQRELALLENLKQQARLDEVTHPILLTGTSLCSEDRGQRIGMRFATVQNFPRDLQLAATEALGLNDTLTILSVASAGSAARAGLQQGDRIIAVGPKALRTGPGAAKHFSELVAENASAANNEISLMVQRGPERRRVAVRQQEVCDYGAVVVNDTELNAFADGKAIYVTSAMLRFVDDDELRVVVSHEFAHNAMGHIKAKKKNSLFGAILGALGDLAMASQGVNTGGYYTNKGAKAGAMSFSQDFEREADYAGIYALALADLRVSSAPTFWRRMAIADPKAIGFAHSHPTTAERFVRLEQAIYEVNQKIALRQPLEPDPAGAPKPVQQPGYEVASAEWAADTAGTPGTPQVSGVRAEMSLDMQDSTIGAAQVYSEFRPSEVPKLAGTAVMQLPSQPTSDAQPTLPAYTDSSDASLSWAPPIESGDWLGQPHGRVYYSASCQAARELPEPIFFKSEEDAQRVGYRRSHVPGC